MISAAWTSAAVFMICDRVMGWIQDRSRQIVVIAGGFDLSADLAAQAGGRSLREGICPRVWAWFRNLVTVAERRRDEKKA